MSGFGITFGTDLPNSIQKSRKRFLKIVNNKCLKTKKLSKITIITYTEFKIKSASNVIVKTRNTSEPFSHMYTCTSEWHSLTFLIVACITCHVIVLLFYFE